MYAHSRGVHAKERDLYAHFLEMRVFPINTTSEVKRENTIPSWKPTAYAVRLCKNSQRDSAHLSRDLKSKRLIFTNRHEMKTNNLQEVA